MRLTHTRRVPVKRALELKTDSFALGRGPFISNFLSIITEKGTREFGESSVSAVFGQSAFNNRSLKRISPRRPGGSETRGGAILALSGSLVAGGRGMRDLSKRSVEKRSWFHTGATQDACPPFPAPPSQNQQIRLISFLLAYDGWADLAPKAILFFKRLKLLQCHQDLHLGPLPTGYVSKQKRII
jgi:hypothetical protein